MKQIDTSSAEVEKKVFHPGKSAVNSNGGREKTRQHASEYKVVMWPKPRLSKKYNKEPFLRLYQRKRSLLATVLFVCLFRFIEIAFSPVQTCPVLSYSVQAQSFETVLSVLF